MNKPNNDGGIVEAYRDKMKENMITFFFFRFYQMRKITFINNI